MENKKFVGTQMLETSWSFIKDQFKIIDSWFLITFVSFIALVSCILAGVFFVAIQGLFLIPVFMTIAHDLSFSTFISLTILLIAWVLAIFIIYKIAKYSIGFLNVIQHNSLDVALGRPMRKFEQRDDRLSFIILFMMSGLLTVIGFFFFILPGIFFIIKTSMAYSIMLEEKCSPLQAISKSFDMTRGNFWPIGISFSIFYILSWIPFVNIINIFIPFSSLNLASLYAQLKKIS